MDNAIKSVLVVVLLGSSLTSTAQSALNSAGGSKVVGGNTHSWSVGEMALVNTAASGNIIVTQGLLQPPSSPVSVTRHQLPGLFEIFPNPATNVIGFRYQFPKAGTLQYTLLDATGKTVRNHRFEAVAGGGSETIALDAFAAGTYLLQIRFTDAASTVSNTTYTIQKIR